jgi:hypothetical protein
MEVFSNEIGCYSCERMWKLLANVEFQTMPLNKLYHCLELEVWGDLQPISLFGSSGNYFHKILVEEADLQYPIELWPQDWYNDDIVANGYHRLLKAYKMGVREIRVRHIPEELLMQAIVM